jgi:hypothetical protein
VEAFWDIDTLGAWSDAGQAPADGRVPQRHPLPHSRQREVDIPVVFSNCVRHAFSATCVFAPCMHLA